jgi:NhaA family Na+:H+ antiporter
LAFHPADETGRIVGDQLAHVAHDDDVEVTADTLRDASRLTREAVSRLAREAVSPLARMEAQLHPRSAYAILPIFALADAGVPVSLDGIADALTGPVGLGIALGLVVGAPLGGFVAAWTLVRLTPARLQQGLDWSAIGGVAPLKGIGFTVAIFISVLAFDDPALQDQPKLAILISSAIAAMIGLTVLVTRARLRARHER